MNNFTKNKPINSLSERIKRTPKDNPQRGYWINERGLSTYIPVPTQLEIIALLNHFNLEGIKYNDGMPDFGPCSIATVCIDNMSASRKENFSECNIVCSQNWNLINYLCYSSWTEETVELFRTSNDLSWHERNDRITCDLVPSKINLFFLHLGGVAECKRAKNA